MLSVALYNERQHRQIQISEGALNVGSNPDILWKNAASCPQLLVIDDPLIAAKQLSLKWSGSTGVVELTNHGSSLALSSGPRIHSGRTVSLKLPASFCIGDTQIQVLDQHASHELDFGLTTLAIDDETGACDSNQRNSPGPSTLAAWLETLGKMQRAVAGSQELFKLAARAVFNPGGLDGSMILIPSQNGGWDVAASHIPYPDYGIGFREDLVIRASDSRATVYHDANLTDTGTTVDDLHTAVVCPIIGKDDEVIGVVYGFRSLHRRNNRRGIRFLEAQFVQVVADALSAAMIRLETEANAARSKVLLEQAFAPGIARRLQSHPELLIGQDREVTVMFADLRGFSTIAERVGTRVTYELLADVMDCFSSAINDHDGVIIDYYGDGVSAFWNAPLDQPEHAVLACQAGLELLNCLPELNQIWQSRIGCELRVGIGIHTGEARVGNSGSRTRLKYGPRGTTVNLASRLESLTKKVGVPILISGDTAEQVTYAFDTKRVFCSELPGIKLPTEVFQVFRKDETIEFDSYRAAYDQSLRLFEEGKMSEALLQLAEMKLARPEDPLTDFLLRQVQNQARLENESFDESGKSNEPTRPARDIENRQ